MYAANAMYCHLMATAKTITRIMSEKARVVAVERQALGGPIRFMFKMKVFGNGFLLTLWLVLMPKKIVVQISDSIHQNLAT
jgi:hypothetical protein